MTLGKLFQSQKWSLLLHHRLASMVFLLDLVEERYRRNKNSFIIETGTARDIGNWAGDGQSTLIWNFACSRLDGLRAFSIDIDSEAVTRASSQTSHVSYINADSIETLKNWVLPAIKDCCLLYLDSKDIDRERPMESAEHCLEELKSVYDDLSSGCLVAIDDCFPPQAGIGKHLLAKEYLREKNAELIFEGYQSVWRKK